MGVPSFFRWVKERYPSCVCAPEELLCDNLYIDMNGIIHPCFHPETSSQPTTYEEVYSLILQRLEELIAVARPRKLLYLAIDGPAPRAKMNQQRGRRFRTALESQQSRTVEAALRERFAAEGRELPAAKPPSMDSNVITPGTEFMAMLGRWLRHWAYVTLNAPARPPFRIVLSDASVPGEGEHKAMGYIRAQRHASGYDTSLHHVIHGMDADLIMLALATHEPRFSILREKQQRGGRGGKSRGAGHSGGVEGAESAATPSAAKVAAGLEVVHIARCGRADAWCTPTPPCRRGVGKGQWRRPPPRHPRLLWHSPSPASFALPLRLPRCVRTPSPIAEQPARVPRARAARRRLVWRAWRL